MGIFDIFKKNKKEKEVDPLEPTTKLIFVMIKAKASMTSIKLKFEDGREMITILHDFPYQHTSPGYRGKYNLIDKQEAYAGPVLNGNSLSRAKNFLLELSVESKSYINDVQNTTKAIVGKVIEAEIVGTEDYEVDFEKAEVVAKE
jgi:hypothetical protein